MSFLPKIRFLGKPAKKIFQLTFQVNIHAFGRSTEGTTKFILPALPQTSNFVRQRRICLWHDIKKPIRQQSHIAQDFRFLN